MKSKFIYLGAIAFLAFASVIKTGNSAGPRSKVQVVYREDQVQGEWNIYIFGTICEEGKLTLHEPTQPRVEPLRIQCVEPRE